MPIKNHLRRILEQQETLSIGDASELMHTILAGEASEIELAALLGAMAGRRETSTEIAGFAITLRGSAKMLPLNAAERENLVDTCGTGGDSSGSFNISTAAALIAAAAGVTVAKHGNRAITSRCGSADVLEALGIPIQLGSVESALALRQQRFVFLLAPAHHPQLKTVGPVRKALGVRSVLHILGPLLNPAGARRQVMGVYQSRLVPVVAEAMTFLEMRHAMVVHGDGGLDELAISGPSQIAEVLNGGVREYTIGPEDCGLERAPLTALQGGDAADNALILKDIFAGKKGPPRDVSILNAAAVLVVGGMAKDLPSGVRVAEHTIDSGAVRRLVEALRSGVGESAKNGAGGSAKGGVEGSAEGGGEEAAGEAWAEGK
ncbi:MAG: anthranilate phosphoribosyltransferase [Acidobacteriaceae bacterium]